MVPDLRKLADLWSDLYCDDRRGGRTDGQNIEWYALTPSNFTCEIPATKTLEMKFGD